MKKRHVTNSQVPRQFVSTEDVLLHFLEAADCDAFVAAHPDAVLLVDNPGMGDENASFQTLAHNPKADTASAARNRLLERLGKWTFVLRKKNRFASMITVGRAASSDLRLNVASVSKFHAYLTHVAREKCWYLADANSSNGTFISGRELPPSHGKVKLENGSTLRFGPDVTCQFYDAAGIWTELNSRRENRSAQTEEIVLGPGHLDAAAGTAETMFQDDLEDSGDPDE